jgi:hypothetical protein
MALTYSPHVDPQCECTTLRYLYSNDAYLLALPDALMSNGTWATLQLGFAIICACIPLYRSLFPRGNSALSSLVQRILSTTGSKSNNSSYISKSSKAKQFNSTDRKTFNYSNSNYTNLSENSDKSHINKIDNDHNSPHGHVSLYPMHSINVQRTVDVV